MSEERLTKLAPLIATILIPVVLGVLGNQYSKDMKEREVQGEFVSLAVGILNQPPTESNRNIRIWATSVLNKYSGVQLSQAAQDDLINNISFDASKDFDIKDSGLNVDMNGGPVRVSVEFAHGNSGTYYLELLVDGNYDNSSEDEPLVFSPSLIESLHSLPLAERDSLVQVAITNEKASSSNLYEAAVIFEQDGRELTREVVRGTFDGETERTVMVNIIEVD